MTTYQQIVDPRKEMESAPTHKRRNEESSTSSTDSTTSSTSSSTSNESYVSSVSPPSSPKVPKRKYEELRNKGMMWVEKAQTYKQMLQELNDKLQLAQKETDELRHAMQTKPAVALPAVDSDDDDLEEQNRQLRKALKVAKKQLAELDNLKTQAEREVILRDARIQQLTERNAELAELNKELRSILRNGASNSSRV